MEREWQGDGERGEREIEAALGDGRKSDGNEGGGGHEVHEKPRAEEAKSGAAHEGVDGECEERGEGEGVGSDGVKRRGEVGAVVEEASGYGQTTRRR